MDITDIRLWTLVWSIGMIAGVCISLVFFAFSKGYKSGYKTAEKNARLDIGVRLKDSSYWFRDIKVKNVLFIIGQKIINNGTYEVSRLREHIEELGEEDINETDIDRLKYFINT